MAGTAFSYAFPDTTFSDADTSDTLSYTATKADDTALPTWLAFAADTRTFSGTPQAADAGTVAVKVIASDGNGGSVSDTFDITVIISVPADWSLKPTAVATGDKFRLLFLSSTKRNASSTDIADYNTFIQTRAAAGHTDIQDYSAGFRVVGCSAAVDARDNTKTTYTMTDKGVPIYWLNGAKAADQYEDFYDGSWDDEANDKNESGTNGPDTSQNNNWPVTGCSHGGTELTTFGASRALGTPQVGVGRPNSSGSGHGPLNGNSQITSGFSRPMYGLSAIFQVAADTTPPTLTSAYVDDTDGLIINLEFSEDLQLSNPPALSAFTVTVDGSAATVSSVGVPGSALPQNALWLQLSTVITQGQAVVVAYADPTTGDDANAIQDAAGNDADSFTTGLNGVPDVINNVLTEVPNNWSLKPTAVAAGDQFRLLFLSSTKRNASSTDIADYNTFIQTRAAAGHTDIQDYSAGFRVVGCTADTDARDNTSTTYTASDKGVPIYWLDGAKAADQYEDFYDGSWDDEANDKNESGTDAHDTSQQVNYPWTGCAHDGTEATGGGGLFSYALGSSDHTRRAAQQLRTTQPRAPQRRPQRGKAAHTRPLYGLSAVFQVAAAVVVPNNPPAFSADTAARSVAENTAAGQNVGAALTATDADSDTLTYTLEGADAASFGIVSGSGQIQTRTGVTYNHEAKSTHTVVVKADDGNGGTDTVTVTITVTDVDEPPGQPAAPTVSATAGSTTSLDVTWTAPTNTGPAIASYDLQYRAGTSGNFTNGPQNVTGTSAAIGSLAADTSYEVQVRATNAEGDGDWSVAGTGRTTATSAPGAPTGLTATASGTTAINLSWSAPASTGGSAITGYKIEVSPDGTSGWTDQVADTSSTTTTYAHTGLAPGDTRHYRVSAINTNGSGTPSNVDSATTGTSVPGAPTGLTATASGTTAINLSWSAPGSTGGSAITGYKIEVSPDGTSGWTDQVADTSSTTTTYAHTGLAPGDTRHYRVSAINTNGSGTASNVDSATTGTSVPGAPTGLTATASGTTAINLSWSAPASTGGSAITGYKIEVSPNGTSGWTDQVADTNSTATTYAHTGLAAGDTRHYRVSAINTNGAGTASNVDSATTATSVPGAPTGLTATASGTTAINLSWSAPASTGGSAITGYKIEVSWTAPASTGSAITGYKIEVSPNGTSGWTDQVADTNSTATTYAHTGLASGDTRHYRVSAINTNGAGTASNVDSATTGTSVPGAPTGLTATASGTTAINLSWTAPASTGGSAITGYKIEVSPNGTSGWTDQVANTNSTATTYAHTGLAGGTTRHYRVSAINTNGAGRLQRRQRHHGRHRARRPHRPHGHGQRGHPDRPLLERPGQHRRLRHHRLQDRGLAQRHLRLDRPGRRHQQHRHHLRAHRAGRRRHPPLPRLRHQHQRRRHRLQRRQRHHRHQRARRPDRPHGHGQRDHPDRPLLERPGQHRRLRHHRLQDRGLAQRHLRLDRPGRQHQQHRHHLRPHRAGRRHQPPLPRLRHQHQRRRHRLQRRQRHHGATVPGAPPASRPRPAGPPRSTSPGAPRAAPAAPPSPATRSRSRPTAPPAGPTRSPTPTAPPPPTPTPGLPPATPATTASPPSTPTAPAPPPTSTAPPPAPPPPAPRPASRPRPAGPPRSTSPGAPRPAPAAPPSPATRSRSRPTAPPAGPTRSPTPTAPPPLTPTPGWPPAHPPLPRLRHQHQRRRHRLQRRQRHHRRQRARRPTGLTATASGTTQIDLSWSAPGSTGGSAITGYKIEVSANGTSGWTDQVADTNSTATTYAHTGLAAGDTRHYRVSAINTNGAGTASNVDSATTGTTAPGAPTGLTATASGTTQIDLSWSAPASTGGSAITGYKIEVSPNGTSGWTDQVADTNSTATTYAHTGLAAGDTRHYRVSAINTNGAGTASNRQRHHGRHRSHADQRRC